MNVLVTGANGFIGKAVTKKLLDSGYDVFAIVTSKDDMNDIVCSKLHIFELFFEQYPNISNIINNKIDAVIHLAWAGLNGPSAKDVELQLSNVIATKNLLEQAKLLGMKKFIFASSMNTLEVRSMLNEPENYKTRGTHIHVASKLNAEVVARVFCDENDIQYNEAIIAMAYGEGNKSNMIVNTFIRSLLNNQTPKLIEGNNLYDLIYVDDIANAFVSILEFGKAKKSYYIGHNWNRTFKDLFLEIGEIVNPNIKLVFGEYPEDNKIDFSLIDRELLTKDTGWKPCGAFDNTILKTIEWLRRN